jgi:FkbM family methyltransferase
MTNHLARMFSQYLPAKVMALLRRVVWLLRPPEREVFLAKQAMNLLGGTAIDVGANNGLYTLSLSSRATRVIAFEANPVLVKFLRSVSPPNVQIEQFALSNKPGQLLLRIPRVAGVQNPGMATVSQFNTFESQFVEAVDDIAVTAMTLDQYVLSNNVAGISFIKIDVEGFEKEVLDGAMQTIKSQLPMLLIETELRHKADVDSIFNMLEELGYLAHIVSATGSELVPVTAGQVRELQSDSRLAAKQINHFDFTYVNNFFFIPSHMMSALASLTARH